MLAVLMTFSSSPGRNPRAMVTVALEIVLVDGSVVVRPGFRPLAGPSRSARPNLWWAMTRHENSYCHRSWLHEFW
jgi:hypothetical protein